MDVILEILITAWAILIEMSPWLLLGFALAGVLGVVFPEEFIRRHLSKRSIWSIVKAVFIGIPLPLCSCGVIPVATMLRNAGASKGSVAAFTASTPQTGVDSISATYSLMGIPFTLGRIAADVIAGLFAGFVINLYEGRGEPSSESEEKKACCDSTACDVEDDPAPKRNRGFSLILKKGFIEIPRDIGGYIAVGIVLGAVLSVVIPANLLEQYLGTNPFVMYALVTVLSVPVYVCATG